MSLWLSIRHDIKSFPKKDSKGRQSQGFELFVATFFDSGSTMLNQFECAVRTTGICMWFGSRDILPSYKFSRFEPGQFKVLWPGSCCQSVLPCLGVDGGRVRPESWSCKDSMISVFNCFFNCSIFIFMFSHVFLTCKELHCESLAARLCQFQRIPLHTRRRYQA